MCGIAGAFYRDAQQPMARHVIQAMGESIEHRGPDGVGYWLEDDGIGLVHRRLSIIDLDGGTQPIGNEDGSIQVVFNGEIYNYRELRDSLEKRGHKFRTNSDTEVLVHLYEDHGADFVTHLRGMFAIALWDRREQRLVLSRDRVGIKPLFIFRDGRRLVFGSELKAILAHPDIPRDFDPAAVEEYFVYGMIPGARSIFQGVSKLLPGHTLVIDRNHWDATPQKYWQLNFEADRSMSVDDWKHAVLEKLDETVRTHMVADVPVGAFLSGGVDSSVIVKLAAGKTSNPLQTFSMGFNEAEFNELPYAREVAELVGSKHVEQVVTPDAADMVWQLAHHYDEPFADSSAVPTFMVSKLAAKHVKVVLSGDGGDEAFGGYSRYAHDLKEAKIRRCVPRFIRRSLLRCMAHLWPKADFLPKPLRLKTFLTNMSLDEDAAYANTLTLCRQPRRSWLLNPDVLEGAADHDVSEVVRRNYAQGSDTLHGMIAADMGTLLPDDYLVKVDRASMAHGLEVRPPLLDHEFLELCARVPAKFKIKGGETKWLLKESFRGQLPDSVLFRRKQGFEIPVDAWFKGPLRELYRSYVLNPSAAIFPLINPGEAGRMFISHEKGRARLGNSLWSLLSLGVWAERYLPPVTNYIHEWPVQVSTAEPVEAATAT